MWWGWEGCDKLQPSGLQGCVHPAHTCAVGGGVQVFRGFVLEE